MRDSSFSKEQTGTKNTQALDQEIMNNWEPTIGLEVHVQLATNSKIFSSAPATFGANPNANANNIDLAMPGSLPVLNEAAVRMAIKFGLSIDAEIASVCRFDRKNYFYPDLPKGYQISQLDQPIVGRGTFKMVMSNGDIRQIGITRAHLEEDAGKSIHGVKSGLTGIDLNRAGTPLLEIVSEPELRSAEEAAEYFRKLHALVTYLEICDGNLSEGSMRCDANVSVRDSSQSELGERTEIKNINSFRFVQRAVEYEISRQIGILETGGTIERETRLYDADLNETRQMRGKELSADYRYFPDPDLPSLTIPPDLVETIRSTLPEMPEAKTHRYIGELGLPMSDALRLTSDHAIAQYFENVVDISGNAKSSANWILGPIFSALNNADLETLQFPVSEENLGTLIRRVDDGTISSKIAKDIFDSICHEGGSVDDLIKSKGLHQLNNTDELEKIILKILENNPKQVEQFLAGKQKLLGFFVGQAMRATSGKANPKTVNDLLEKFLSKS